MVTYYPSLNCFNRMIKDSLIREAKIVFSRGFMISFRNARKISSYLVRIKLYPVENTVVQCSVINSDAKFELMSQKLTPLQVLSQARPS